MCSRRCIEFLKVCFFLPGNLLQEDDVSHIQIFQESDGLHFFLLDQLCKTNCPTEKGLILQACRGGRLVVSSFSSPSAFLARGCVYQQHQNLTGEIWKLCLSKDSPCTDRSATFLLCSDGVPSMVFRALNIRLRCVRCI